MRAASALVALPILVAWGDARAAGGEIGLGASADTTSPAPAELDPEGAATANPPAESTTLPEAPPEAPPPLPHKKGLVLESSLGALGFLGSFRRVAPTAPWLHTQLGYELFKWLMFFGEGELAFTDTSNAQDASKTRAFPIFAFGGGGRFTLHFTERTAIFAQGDLGLMKADVANNAFALLGYRKAERLGLYFGGRLGFEWYQIDRHLALGVQVGVRDATGFAKTIGGGDTPVMWDGGVALRYTFPL